MNISVKNEMLKDKYVRLLRGNNPLFGNERFTEIMAYKIVIIRFFCVYYHIKLISLQ